MWQRKQTVFLVIVGACMAFSIFFPIWRSHADGLEKALFPLHYSVTEGEVKTTVYFPYSLTAIFAIAAATLAFFSIGKFHNRLLQIKLGALNSLIMAGSIGSAVYFATDLIKTNQEGGEYGFALYLPIAAMISNMVANRFIKKDEKLVRDSDRLR
ncbi:MAG TPA: hypothetical protein DIS90_11275 [Cytophagales bacterium]|nr:hypothetical protein [Cytophagales bacterium]HCR54152.1 hypothetical protein [Cytophagales bacterium]